MRQNFSLHVRHALLPAAQAKSLFDEIAHMSVHGLALSAVARIKRMAWGTVARWLGLAARYSEQVNFRMLKGFLLHELQADEIRTFAQTK